MKEHELKCWPEPFQAVLNGKKTHEWRRDDRGYAVGDVLRLQEWDPHAGACHSGYWTGREVRVVVTYISRGQFDIPQPFVVMSIQREATP